MIPDGITRIEISSWLAIRLIELGATRRARRAWWRAWWASWWPR